MCGGVREGVRRPGHQQGHSCTAEHCRCNVVTAGVSFPGVVTNRYHSTRRAVLMTSVDLTPSCRLRGYASACRMCAVLGEATQRPHGGKTRGGGPRPGASCSAVCLSRSSSLANVSAPRRTSCGRFRWGSVAKSRGSAGHRIACNVACAERVRTGAGADNDARPMFADRRRCGSSAHVKGRR